MSSRSTGSDTSEPTDYQFAYRKIQARFDALLGAAVDAIVIIDEQGVIETFNKAAEEMFGFSAEQAIGRNVSILMPEPYASQHDQYMHNYHNSGKAKIIGIGREVKGLKADGTVFPIELSVGEIQHSSGHMYVGIIRDITTRVQAQQEAHEIRERLAHVTRVGTMGEMASGIAHEINQPLAAISNYANACKRLLESGLRDVSQLAEVLDKISTQAHRAGEVIRRLRTFFKKRKGERERCHINELIRESVDISHADTRLLDHPVILNLSNDLSDVIADPVQLQQVVLNLLRNAIDAVESAQGEPVTIISQQYDEDFIEVVVVDHGGGIDDETASQLFNPFFSTKASGMGMGLPISQSIVNSHGGRLWLESSDNGSQFHFTIPIAPPE